MNVQELKQRFGIIGNSILLDRAIDIAKQVAPTDLSVLITGESGVGKEVFPQIIHQLSARKHGQYIAVNCGAIPEGTIDSELFGHEKGSFTGAHEARKGYFEVVNGGTIFLDEVAEMPMSTQARLLRILESGEFIKVGSSKVLKTDVRIIAATNVNITEAINKGRFREDLYYRLNTVPIKIPALHERKEDIYLLFRKFASDFAAKYRMPPVKLDDDAQQVLSDYVWPGNIRQLKNFAEQISVIEKKRDINSQTVLHYFQQNGGSTLPILQRKQDNKDDLNEREILYKVLFDMKKDLVDLKKLVVEIISHDGHLTHEANQNNAQIINKLYQDVDIANNGETAIQIHRPTVSQPTTIHMPEAIVEESLSIEEKEIDLIKKALDKHRGRRKNAAKELGISERTLYRKINEYKLEG
jgi:transcriptional regulator with PAS, ATPase and Fis domain